MRSTNVRGLYLLLFFIFCSYLHVLAQENYALKKINFAGNEQFSKEELLENMSLKEYNLIDKWIKKEDPSYFYKELLKSDLDRLQKFYQREGFMDAGILYEVNIADSAKKIVNLKLLIHEGKPVHFASVSFSVDQEKQPISDSTLTRIEQLLQAKKGERFRDETVLGDKEAIVDLFYQLGYAYCSCENQLNYQPSSRQVGVHYTILPGPKCVFGETTLINESYVSDAFIQKEIAFQEGETFNSKLIEDTRRALNELYIFEVVAIEIKKDPQKKKSSIPIILKLKAGSRSTTKFGVGLGTEDKFRTYLDYTYKGFPGEITNLKLHLKHSALEPYDVSLKVSQPQLFDKNSSLAVHPYLSMNNEPGYMIRTIGYNVPFQYFIRDKLNLTLSYYFENVKQLDENIPEASLNRESEDFKYNKSGLYFNSTYDRSFPKFSPTKGYKLSGGVRLNGYLFGGAFDYTKVWAKAHYYKSLGSVVLAFKAFGGGVLTIGNTGFVPVEDRFYAGGSQSVRGWSRSTLGPKREDGTPLGGNSYLETGLELRYPLFWRIGAVTFIDAGNVWENFGDYAFNEFAYSVGAGLRISTPIGPVRLDLGVPVWNEKKSPQFSISIGQAF